MKAMILAAGLGTRLKPWTLSHPKALVPVGGVPMLERVIVSLREQGFDDITVNVHHFADQISDFLSSHNFGVKIKVSDESRELLDTGGGILYAAPLLFGDNREPVLIHNVDILSNADLRALMRAHNDNSPVATLLVSSRDSSRKLVFDEQDSLRGWHNLKSGEYRPAGFRPAEEYRELAFSGIHVVSPEMTEQMETRGYTGVFPIMDFYLNECDSLDFKAFYSSELKLIDIGKPETLAEADSIFT